MARTDKLEAVSDGYYTSFFAPGDVWCEIRKLDSAGALSDTFYCPVNTTGPIAVNGSGGKLYIILGNPNRLFEVQL